MNMQSCTNKSKLLKEDFQEYARYTASLFVKIVPVGLGCGIIFCGIWMYHLQGLLKEPGFLPLFFLLLGLGLLLFRIFYGRLAGWLRFQKAMLDEDQGKGTVLEQKIDFYDGFLIRSIRHGSVQKFLYEDLRQEKETPHLYILRFKKRSPVFFLKDSFTEGSLKEMQEKLRTK